MTQTDSKTLLLLKPRGFCAGVVRAIDIVRIALETFGAPIYVRKEIVHNRYVVDELTAKGAIFVDSVEEVPAGERVMVGLQGLQLPTDLHSCLDLEARGSPHRDASGCCTRASTSRRGGVMK